MHIRWSITFIDRFLITLLEIRSYPGNLLFASSFIMLTISAGEVSFAKRAIGKVDWRNSMTVNICSVGVEMRCGLNTSYCSSARIPAFFLSEQASELSRRRIGEESLICSIDASEICEKKKGFVYDFCTSWFCEF